MTEQQIVNLLQVDLTRFPELSPDERVELLSAGKPLFGYRYNGSEPRRANRVAVLVGREQVEVRGPGNDDVPLVWRNNITVKDIRRAPNETGYQWVSVPTVNLPPYLGM